MRKVLPILLALALAVPALADVTVSVDEGTPADGIAEINLAIDGGSVVRGLALKVTITDAELAAVEDVTDVMADFNAYIDYYFDNPDYLTVDLGGDENNLPGGTAVAVADPDAAGVLDVLPATVFSISIGALDNSGAQGGVDTGGLLCNIQLSTFTGATAEVCVEADALRGGIVGDDLGTVTDADCEDILATAPECQSKFTGGELTDYLAYITAGEDPSCWCWQFQCRGDANNDTQGTLTKYRVYTNDLNKILDNWKLKFTTSPVADPCADIMHDSQGTLTKYRVYTNDLNECLANWKAKDTALTDCPSYIP